MVPDSVECAFLGSIRLSPEGVRCKQNLPSPGRLATGRESKDAWHKAAPLSRENPAGKC